MMLGKNMSSSKSVPSSEPSAVPAARPSEGGQAAVEQGALPAGASAEVLQWHLPAKDIPAERRIALLEAMMGEADDASLPFVEAIRRHTTALYDQYITPLFEAHWPEKKDAADAQKLRFLACRLYASAPYTVLFCAERPHWLVKLATATGNTFGLKERTLGKGAAFAMRIFGPLYPARDHRRIVLIGAFIATIDHAFDHYMDDVEPKERERRIKGLLNGTWAPDHGALKLTRAIQEAMEEGIPDEERPIYDAALARVVEWVESEVAGMTGIEDPRGLCHRLAGVEGTIDGLIFPVHKYAGETARQWMYDVSLFVQMMDDWIDYESDLQDIRSTPVITGKWNLGIIQNKWDDTIAGIEALAKGANMGSPAYQRFVRDAYVMQMHDVMHAMIHGTAA